MNTLRLKKGDTVRVIAGSLKGKTGKVVAVLPKKGAVKLEGLNVVKRHVKPNMLNPQGGIQELHQAIDISKVALVHPTKKDAVTRISYKQGKDGIKIRQAVQANNKEITS